MSSAINCEELKKLPVLSPILDNNFWTDQSLEIPTENVDGHFSNEITTGEIIATLGDLLPMETIDNLASDMLNPPDTELQIQLPSDLSAEGGPSNQTHTSLDNPLALDLCKVYMDLFTEELIRRFGIHYPMTAFFVNNGRLSTDITIVVPDPLFLLDLPSSSYAVYDGHYQEIKCVLKYLAEKWSVHIKFI